NTVQTLLRIMEDKGLVTHYLDGRAFVYEARYSRDQSAERFLDRVFDGAASQLMLSLLQSERIPADELDRMQALIAAANPRRGPVWLPLPWHLPSAPTAAPAPAPVASVTPAAPAPERVPEPEEFALVWVERSTHLTPSEAAVLTDVPAIQPPPRRPATPPESA